MFKMLNNRLLEENNKLSGDKMEAINEKDLTKSGVNALTREIEYLRKQAELEKNNIFMLIRDKDMMKKKINIAEEDNQKNKENMIKQ